MTGVFTVTYDTELIWGSFDHVAPRDFERRYPDVRGTIAGILALLERYEIAATWAVVGHLFLAECRRDATGRAHGEMVHPPRSPRVGDWYSADPCTDRARDPLWYGDDVIDAIRAARPVQEIGCHSFAHAPYGNPAMTPEAARSDLAACVALAAEREITLRSFVFPRNSEGHHAALREAGFRVFRGADPTWHGRLPRLIGRAAHLADQVLGLAPPVSRPVEHIAGLWNVPGSCLLMDATGLRRLVPQGSRIRKARLGLRRAAQTGGVFHLWTHPFNLSSDRRYMLGVLDAVLRDAAEARAKGLIRIAPMGSIPDLYGARPDGVAVDRTLGAASLAGQDLTPSVGLDS